MPFPRPFFTVTFPVFLLTATLPLPFIFLNVSFPFAPVICKAFERLNVLVFFVFPPALIVIVFPRTFSVFAFFLT